MNGMTYYTEIKFRTIKDGDEAEGECRLYFSHYAEACDFFDAAKKSEDTESADVANALEGKILLSWEK